MDPLGVLRSALFDELSKIAASRKNMTVAQSRKGRRPMHVSTLLRKEKDGSLYKYTGEKTAADLVNWNGQMLTLDEVAQDCVERIKRAAGLGTNSAGYKLQGKTNFQGLSVAIENRKGSVRKGENDDGSKWRTKYKVPYGYIEGTKGADNEEVDAYVGPKKDADTAFVVRQKKDDGSYDEDTVMLGFKNKAEAKKTILQHYDDPKYIGKVVPVAMDKLKGLVKAKKRLVKLSSGDMIEYFQKHPGKLEEWKARRKKKLTKTSSSEGSEQARLEFSEGVPRSGLPAKLPRRKGDVPSRDKLAATLRRLLKLGAPRKKGDVPSREGGPGRVKAENRQDFQKTMIGEGDAFPATDAYSKPSEERVG